MYLLDTPILLELRKAKAAQTDPGLAAWGASTPRDRLFLSALSLLEVANSAAVIERSDKAGAAALRAWIDAQLLPAFDGRILPIDAAVARRRAQLDYTDSRDALLAATALVHGLTLVTRDIAAFTAGRVKLLNPWGYALAAGGEEEDWNQAGRSGPLWLRNLFVR